MEQEKFLTNLFRALAVITPVSMIIKSIFEKNFRNITGEVIILALFALVIVYIAGVNKGLSLKNNPPRGQKKRVRDR